MVKQLNAHIDSHFTGNIAVIFSTKSETDRKPGTPAVQHMRDEETRRDIQSHSEPMGRLHDVLRAEEMRSVNLRG